MEKYLWLLILFLEILVSGGRVLANHIMGGEMKMKAIGSEKFGVSLIQFWKKKNLIIPKTTSGGNRAPSADLYIYSKRGKTYMGKVTVYYQLTSTLEYQTKTCATARSLETIEESYKGTVLSEPRGIMTTWVIIWFGSDAVETMTSII